MTRYLLGWALVWIGALTAAFAESRHVVVPGWPMLPQELVLGQCVGVGVDAANRVFVFHRSGRKWSQPFPEAPIAAATVSVFDGNSGALLQAWGAGRFLMPHGLTIDPHGNVWLTDVALQQVFQFTPEGKLLLTLGEARVPGTDASHFNLPTDVAVLADGSCYVSDGYRNTRVVKFSAGGRYEFEWGTKGGEPGQFVLPHGITLDAQGRVYVCDRTNSRIQIFDGKGAFLQQWKGPQIGRPYGIGTGPEGHLFLVDGGDPAQKIEERGKIVELDRMGTVIDCFSGPGLTPGRIQLGHDLAVGPDGAVYVAEATGQKVQKFAVRKAP
ncbi:MAG: peptidyl-alpha-hydroxyglycine alpha-amidating lyase family protein [Verrucomicrobiales bacterium]|nr:hypothetical protein [Verrucomicrobiae bacterium]MCP5552597.1 hypothetical protein [Akkermansiaceae bacterium]